MPKSQSGFYAPGLEQIRSRSRRRQARKRIAGRRTLKALRRDQAQAALAANAARPNISQLQTPAPARDPNEPRGNLLMEDSHHAN